MKLNITNQPGQIIKAPKTSESKKPKTTKGGDLRSRGTQKGK